MSWPVARRCCTRPCMSSPRERAAMFTVERSRASLASRPARSGLSQFLATTNCASVSESLATSASARGGRQAFQHQHRFTDRGEMAVTLDDAVPGERRQLRIGVLDQLERCGRRADFGNRGGYRRRQIDPARDGALRLAIAGRDDVDEIGVDQKRGMFEHRQRDRRLVERERLHDRGRRFRAAREHLAPWPGEPAGMDRRAASTARLRRRRDRPRKDLKSARPAPKPASPLPARLPERYVSN